MMSEAAAGVLGGWANEGAPGAVVGCMNHEGVGHSVWIIPAVVLRTEPEDYIQVKG